LWLCHNELQNIEDLSSVAKSINLKEITIENNPISLAGDCVSFLVSYLPLLNSLNQLQITEQVRRAANAWRKSKENSDQNFQHLSSDVSSSIRREEIISNARTNWELIRQANIINGTQRQLNSIKQPPTKAPKLTQNNSSSSTSTTSSTMANSSNVKAKISTRPVINVAKNQRRKMTRSSSVENPSLIVSEKETDGECEYFHLPPVLGQCSPEQKKNQSAASSTRPNFDSESSIFSSDTEEHRSFKSRIPTTPPIHPVVTNSPPSPTETINNDTKRFPPEDDTQPLPPLIASSPVNNTADESVSETAKKEDLLEESNLPTLVTQVKEKEKDQPKATLTIVDNSNGISLQPSTTRCFESDVMKVKTVPADDTKVDPVDTDKLSLNSRSSAKSSSESLNTVKSANEERHVQSSNTSHHLRSRSGARKPSTLLIRSQTARNLSSHLSNQQNVGNNQAAHQRKETKKETDKDREQGELEF
jgi:hypothetical protein